MKATYPSILIAALLCGCAGKAPPAYLATTTMASTTAQTREANGLKLTVDPFFDRERSQTYFKVNAVRDGVAIVHVRAENHSADATYLLHSDNFKFRLPGSEAESSVLDQVNRSSAGGQTLAILGAGGVVGFIGLGMISEATMVQHNFTVNELRSQTLAPGQAVSGFVYFGIPKDQRQRGTGVLSLTVPETRTQSPLTFEFPLTYEAK